MKWKSSLKYGAIALAMLVQIVSPAIGFGGEAFAQDAAADNPAAAEKTAPKLSGTVQITGGLGFTVALKADGTVWTWGDNARGKLGYGDVQMLNRYSPGQVKGLSDVKAVAAGMYHTLALKNDGTVWSWGYNTNGQLGTGDKKDASLPAQVEGLYHIVSIAAGNDFSVALDDFGDVYAWGNNSKNQLGDGTTTERLKPNKVPKLDSVKAIAAGAAHVIAISKWDSVVGWGDNSFRQIGNGGYGDTISTPSVTNAATAVKAIAAGSSFSLALDNYGSVWSWGSNLRGQLANGNTYDDYRPSMVVGGRDVIQIAAGSQHAVALKADGTIVAWGSNSFGQLGSGDLDRATEGRQIQNGFNDIAIIGSGFFHTMAVKGDGSLWVWGNNLTGQLGDGTTTNRISPALLARFNMVKSAPAAPSSATGTDAGGSTANPVTGKTNTIAAGEGYSMFINNGKLWSWGDNVFGQLGDGSHSSKNKPVSVMDLPGPASVAAGTGHSMAVNPGGHVSAWGLNAFGQLGNGTNTNQYSPAELTGMNDAVQAVSGNSFTAVLKKDGTVWTTGDNTYGQLGVGSGTGSTSFTQITELPKIIELEAGYSYVLALAEDGTLYAWGDNANGQLGDSSTASRKFPAPVVGISDVVAMKAGRSHSLAVKKDGSLWAWGLNINGQLGDGTTVNRTLPVKVAGLENVKAVAAGGSHSLALLSDGTVYSWGFNFFGQLGNGTNSDSSSPVKISQLSQISEIAAGSSHSLALGSNGTVWSWGANYSGQLGDGSLTNRSVPAVVSGFAAAQLSDVTGHWAASAIANAIAKGYVDGYEDGTFRPNNPITRAEFAKMVSAALGVKPAAAQQGDAWYTPYANALLAANLYGQSEAQSEWNGLITRKELAQIAVRATDTLLQKPDTKLETNKSILIAVQKGLLQGLEQGSLGPDEPTTRAQAITIIERILKVNGGGTLEVDQEAVKKAEALNP
ncbi:S-layer homology domain-containing protein [Paenibacillus thalictri]|uniref:RCC1 repeat-containing protein n=1 Tax=Paenibacillus thalictri TaxID=2527873 RepID=A0A4Q9DKS6_9BACL|nr:S-layer homology domain-containing protein [Paenibacillus thalictri]TBL75358.1 RCC1 repeat-containing protein [Paenibacillus thalictri]